MSDTVSRGEVREHLRMMEEKYAHIIDAGYGMLDVERHLAVTRHCLAALDDAERWQFVCKFFDVDGEAECEYGANYEHVTVDEDALFKATVTCGLGRSVESLVDAARAGGEG